jgi:hypothetical protein
MRELLGCTVRRLQELLSQEDWREAEGNPHMQERTVYVGTIMANFPSGRVYAPWSDVSEAEAEADESYLHRLEDLLHRNGMYLTGNPGDGCDMLIGEARQKPEADEDEA